MFENNAICKLLNIKYPIFQGGMAWIGTAELASAVSNAGGLGIIGAGHMPPEILRAEIQKCKSWTDKPFGVNVTLLVGGMKAKEKRIALEAIADGRANLVVGTHAVLTDTVEFKNLGLAIVDEQHRFGVRQRGLLAGKAQSPHLLVMSATPIPRTLGLLMYGDLDISVLDELPPGRKPVTTLLRYDDQRFSVYSAIGRELAKGRQAYIVYPLIQENEKLDLRSLEEGYELIRDTFPHYRVAYVHGRMKPSEKDFQMQLFASHEADILVATTVIEVGVNVPNASMMLIENAERFGLSQLHQLRGRVGRGADQSYCELMSKRKIASEPRKRLELMTATTDGFVIAEADMKMRGPGDIEGTMQSGIPFNLRIASLASDGQLVQLARNAASEILEADPTLSSPPSLPLAREVSLRFPRQVDFSRIS